MEQIYYEQIKALKRQGRYQECIEIYLQHLNDQEADAVFFDGLAKIYMLAGDFDRARRCLLEVFRRTYVFRMEMLDKILNKKLETINEILFSKVVEAEMTKAMKVYELFSSLMGEDHAKVSYGELGLSKIELTMCYCDSFDQTYFRYYFCLACQGNVPYKSEDLCRELLKFKTAILNSFKGVATEEESKQYQQIQDYFTNGGTTNKYALIYSVLPDFAHYIKLN